MKINRGLVVTLLCAAVAHADDYAVLQRRFEKQIKQQEQQLVGLRGRLQEKSRDVVRWKNKAADAKTAWAETGSSLEQTRGKVKVVHSKRLEAKLEADAAQWKTTENVLVARSAAQQARLIAQDFYARSLLLAERAKIPALDAAPEYVLNRVTQLSTSAQKLSETAQKEEASLRTDEMHLQTEEQAKIEEADRLHQKQESHWLNWQEALRRKTSLEDEISQIDQSAKALQVMLQELQEHRDQAKALRENHSVNESAVLALKGTLPWPAHGKVVQNFGRQYPDGLSQLVVSNGIKIDAGQNHTVRSIQEGKVLFANAFRQYGQLVIVQHKNGLTSVYAGLGQTQVKEGQMLAALDQIGLTGDSGSFYFELRRDEQPINPLVYLSPAASAELSLRREFR